MNIMPKPDRNFTIVQNDIFTNYPDMSAKSKFMLLQVLSKPDNWKLNLHWLAKQNSEGMHAVKSTVKEWEAKGFCHKFVIRSNGRIKEVEPVICYPPLEREEAEAYLNQHEKEPLQLDVVADDVTADAAAINICRQETFRQVFNRQETAPIINTVVKQILKETTTTPEPEQVPVICAKAVPSSSLNLELLNLIPEHHRSPMVVTFVNKAVADYPASEIKNAVAYAAGNVRGGSMQFRAYLDKTLKNKWAEGFSDMTQAQGGCLQNHDPETARRHAEGRAWLKSLGIDSLKMLAQGGNIAAGEELLQRGNCSLPYARA